MTSRTATWNPSHAARLAETSAKQLGRKSKPRLIRIALTAVFAVDDLAVKVCAPGHRSVQSLADEQTLVATLSSRGFSVPEPIGNPVELDGCAIGMNRLIPASPTPTLDLAAIGRYLHLLHNDSDLSRLAPRYDPDAEADTLRARLRRLLALRRISRMEFEHLSGILASAAVDLSGPEVLCHCNIHTENVLMHGGRTVLLDWEKASTGPAALDLASIAGRVLRFGLTPSALTPFIEEYGVDPLDQNGIGCLRTRKDLSGMTYLLLSPTSALQREGRTRLGTIIGDSEATWVDR